MRRAGQVARARNPSTWLLRQEDYEFEVKLGYLVRPCLNKQTKMTKAKKW
jgi:hypothetical protein